MADHEELLQLFYCILKRMRKEWNNQIQGINRTQFLILKCLHNSGPQKAVQLAEVPQTTPGAITCATDKLVMEGYAERKGKGFIESLFREQNNVTVKFFQGLPEEDIQHLIRIYNKISENLDQ